MRHLTVFAILSVCACGRALDPLACTEELRYGLNVTVVDSITGAAPPAAQLLVHSDTYAEDSGLQHAAALGPSGPVVLVIGAAGERPGRYDLTVSSPGYNDWTKSGVEVTRADACHVRPVAITARLTHVPTR
jgi:hypothetical protein